MVCDFLHAVMMMRTVKHCKGHTHHSLFKCNCDFCKMSSGTQKSKQLNKYVNKFRFEHKTLHDFYNVSRINVLRAGLPLDYIGPDKVYAFYLLLVSDIVTVRVPVFRKLVIVIFPEVFANQVFSN